jgi:hypothetical protein
LSQRTLANEPNAKDKKRYFLEAQTPALAAGKNEPGEVKKSTPFFFSYYSYEIRKPFHTYSLAAK